MAEAHESSREEAGFSSWNTRRESLYRLFEEAESTARELETAIRADGPSPPSAWLGDAARALERASFRVMFFGDFSSGKSTLINALLGRDELLPTKENPTTAFTTVLRWGEVQRAELYRSGAGDRYQEPEQVTIPEFQDRVSLRMDASGEPAESPYAKATVYLPFDLLKSGVELIDSAGTNESAARERVTLQFLPQVDAIVFVTPARGAFKMRDQSYYLDILKKLGHDDIFFVVNQFDLIRRESDREDVRLRCRNVVSRTSGRTDRLFFISALDALTAEDDDARDRSRVPDLLHALGHFCAHERSRIKLLRPAEVLRRQVSELRKRIGHHRKMLMRSADGLQMALDAKLETRERLLRTLVQIDDVLKSWGDETERLLAETIELHIRQLVADVPNWELPAKPKLHLLRKSRFERWGEAIQQIDEALSQRLQREMHAYAVDSEGLAGFLRDRATMLDTTLGPLLQTYDSDMTDLRSALTGSVEQDDGAQTPDPVDFVNIRLPAEVLSKISPGLSWGTAGAGAGALVLGGGGAGLGLAGGAGMLAVGGLVASVAAPLGLAGAVLVGPLMIRRMARQKLRVNAVAEYAQALEENAGEIAKRQASHYADALRALTAAFHDKLRGDLQGTITEAEELISGFRSDRVHVEDEQRKLTIWDDSFTLIEERTHILVEQILTDMR